MNCPYCTSTHVRKSGHCRGKQNYMCTKCDCAKRSAPWAITILQMNPIELEWQHLKKSELAERMFDDELELAYAVIDGIKARGEIGNYSTKRVKFNSNCSS